MSKKILFNTWAGAFFSPGGGEVQLNNTKIHLQELSYKIDLYNQWEPQTDFDIFHQFSIQLGANYVVDGYKQKHQKKIALSTILWTDLAQTDFYYWQIRDLLLKADILFTNSDAESLKISKDFSIAPEKFHKTRNAITSEFTDSGTADLFNSKYKVGKDFILTVANVDRRKNTKMLVEICKELGLELVVIGAIRDQEYFEEFKGSYDKVQFIGPIYDTNMIRSAYNACRVFALPSLCETPGIAALEAASQGARIVVTDQGAAPEYLGNYAVYVSPTDRDSVKNGLIAGMELKVNGLQVYDIRSSYTLTQTAQDVAIGYNKII